MEYQSINFEKAWFNIGAFLRRGSSSRTTHLRGDKCPTNHSPPSWFLNATDGHQTFSGAGSYMSNTWRPPAAILPVEDTKHPATRHLPATFTSAPNEWYRWENDLRTNPAIKILLSIDSTGFPVGTGPK